jgi:hypothetical protein
MHRLSIPVGDIRRWEATIGLVIVGDRQRDLLEAAHKLLIGAEADLIRNIHGIAQVAESGRKTNRIRNVALAN